MNYSFFWFFIIIEFTLTFGKQSWTVNNIQVEIISDLPQKISQESDISKESKQLWTLGGLDTLTLRFNIKRGSHPARPHQTMLLIGHPEKHLETTLVIPVDSNGKALLNMKHDQIPLPLLFSDLPLTLTLVIGSFGNADPLLYKLGQLEIIDISDKFEKPIPPLRYGPLPEITYTFSSERKNSSKILTILFSIAILAAFAQLFKMWKTVSVDILTLSSILKRLSLPYILFFTLLCAMEFLFYMYWTYIRFPQVLMGIFILTLPLTISCKRVLSQIQKQHIQDK
ncbi:hypothetical protein PCK1_000901 [Pneumocystis canis]|nr:hypothetical protein PCK1_000901 [Pneumocystis canis]